MQDQKKGKGGNNPQGRGGFRAGQSGNPAGRAKMPTAVREMLSAKAEEAVKVCIKHLGDADARVSLKAAEMLLDRAYGKPLPANEPISFALPEDTGDLAALVTLHASLLRATAAGEVSVTDAREMSGLFDNHRRLIEATELEDRIAKLEQTKDAKR
ncbi:MAG: DUF5681 domain-containing protein [Aestuariivirga sp.]